MPGDLAPETSSTSLAAKSVGKLRPMIEYLSAQWIAEANRLLQAAEPDPSRASIVVEQRILAGSNGPALAANYHLGFDPDGCWAKNGPANEPTVIYTQPLQTAVAIATEQRTAHEAFMLGELRVSGDSAQLVHLLPANQTLGDLLRPLRDNTSYDLADLPAGDPADT